MKSISTKSKEKTSVKKYQSLDEIIEKKLDETERLLKGVDLSILKMTHYSV
jgi:hypothetical protein